MSPVDQDRARAGADRADGISRRLWGGDVMSPRSATMRVGAVVAVFVGLFHIVPVPEYLAKAPYLGVMFLLGGLAPFAAAIVMVVPAFPAGLRRLAIALMALACTIMIIMGVISRVVGLPGVGQDPWDAFLIISLVLEAGFLALAPRLLSRS